jgi:hypothetical protein
MPLLNSREEQGCAEVWEFFKLERRRGRQDFVAATIPKDVELALPGTFFESEFDRKVPLLSPDPFPVSFDSFDDADFAVGHVW